MSEDSGPLLSIDAFVLILSSVQISDLFQWRTVSKDFKSIIDYVLRQKKQLSVGNTSGYANLAVWLLAGVRHPSLGQNIADLLAVRKSLYISSLETVLKKCGGIQCLHLRECQIDAKFIKTLTNCLPELSCLHLNRCDFQPRSTWYKKEYLFDKLECLVINKRGIDESLMSEEERDDLLEEPLFYYSFLQRLENLTKLALISEDEFGMDVEDEAIISNLPASLQTLTIFRARTETNLYLEDVLDYHRFTCLRYLDISQYNISDEFLLAINDHFDLISLKFTCNPLEFSSLTRLAERQVNLKTLEMCAMCLENTDPADQVIRRRRPFKNVEQLVLNVFIVRANYEEYQNFFFGLFPNLRTLDHRVSGVICEDIDIGSGKCQTCYDLTFGSLITQMSALRTLCITEDDIRCYLTYFFSAHNLLTKLVVYSSHQFKTEDMLEGIESKIRQIITAFAQKSTDSPKQLFKIVLERSYAILENRDLPRNLVLRVRGNGPGNGDNCKILFEI